MTGWIKTNPINPALCKGCKQFVSVTWDYYQGVTCTLRFCESCVEKATA